MQVNFWALMGILIIILLDIWALLMRINQYKKLKKDYHFTDWFFDERYPNFFPDVMFVLTIISTVIGFVYLANEVINWNYSITI